MLTAAKRDYPDHPLLGVSVAARRGRRVLLVKRGRAPLKGLWSFPGGLVEVGESLREAAAREVREEAGVEVAIGRPLETVEIIHRDDDGIVDRHYVLAVFAADWLSGDIRPGDDAEEACWADPDDLANFTMTPDTARILAEMGKRG